MKFSVSSSILSSRLQALSKVISNKSTLPILDNFLFELSGNSLVITASDSENLMKTSLLLDNCDGTGRFTIPSKTILDATRELPEQPLNFEVDLSTYSVKVNYLNGVYNLVAQSAEEYPLYKELTNLSGSITIPSNLLNTNLVRTLFATGQDELRPVMNGVYFDLTPEHLAIVATDGQKLVRNRISSIKTQAPTAFILPKKPATLLRNVLTKDESVVTINFDQRNAEIHFADGLLSCRLIEGRYPNYNSVIPQENPHRLTIDRKSLISALRRVLPFASSTQLVRLHIELGKLELSSEDLDFSTSAKETLVCDYDSTPMNIGFRGSLLTDVLNNLEGDDVIIGLADPSRAGVILPATPQVEGEEVLMLIMPALLND
ncbi:MAG: DNA polymerase III subunit beta [Prevotellaceae bacterium]|nr:DNA polymerase III subunit beta [Prevotellaceae bacterium]MDY3364750.1 DNA polymerase III subunit beta [Prevotella sp.]